MPITEALYSYRVTVLSAGWQELFTEFMFFYKTLCRINVL